MKLLARFARWMAVFELAFAEYRREQIDLELAYGSVFDIEELFLRKSDINCEIHRIRQDITRYDTVLMGALS